MSERQCLKVELLFDRGPGSRSVWGRRLFLWAMLHTEELATYFVGLALIQSGDVERGSFLMQSFLDARERFDEVDFVSWPSIAGRLSLGNTDAALVKLDGFAETRYQRILSRLFLERSPLFDPIRGEPAFIALLDEYRENAAEQRQILQTMNEDAS